MPKWIILAPGIWLDEQVVKITNGIAAWGAPLITTFLTVRWIFITAGLRRKHALWYSLAVLISWISHVVWKFFGDHALELSLPFRFLLVGIIVTWLYYRWQLYNILPLAQEFAAKNVIEGLLIIDEQDYIVDINPAAKIMLTDLPVIVEGTRRTANIRAGANNYIFIAAGTSILLKIYDDSQSYDNLVA